MSKEIIIIGGGHNGLACAAYLAKAGRRVTVLEASEQFGGLGATREFAPGFKASIAHTLPQLDRKLVDELQLEQHGFALAAGGLPTIALGEDGEHITITPDRVEGAGPEDAEAYREYRRQLQKFARAIKPFWYKRPPRIEGGSKGDLLTLGQFAWNLRTLGKDDMREMMRMIALPARDLVDEFFENPLLKGALTWDANVGSKLAPRSPNNAVLALLLRMSGDLSGGLPLPRGGVGGFTEALASAANSAGAVLRNNARVAEVLVSNGQVNGVRLENGEELRARTVVSNADPKTSFMDLLGARHLDVQFTHRINRLRSEGLVAKLHLALDKLPAFTGLSNPVGRLLLTRDMDTIESAFDEAKYGGFADELPMEVIIPSLLDDSLAPAGKHVLSAQVQYAPYALKGGWDEGRDAFQEAALNTLARYAPDIRDCINAVELLTPADLEAQHNARGGHWHQVEFAIDAWWMQRPTYGASQYKTPVPGFYLCGAGSHPGGGIMGAAGANAAQAILEEN